MFYLLNLSLPMFLLLSSLVIIVSAPSWFIAWMGLELNMMAFMPMIISPNKLSSEASLKYFFTQVMGSVLLLFYMMNSYFYLGVPPFNFVSFSFSYLILLALMLKLGAAPFHFWFPAMIEGLSWNMSFILMTAQKVGPLWLIMMISAKSFLLTSFFIFTSAWVGAVSGMNQLMCRKMMSYSSIAHLSWLLCASMMTKPLMSTYFFFYTLMVLIVTLLLNTLNIFHINQTFYYHNNLIITLMVFYLNLMSLGGLPPFLGFFPKWLIVKMCLTSQTIILILVLVFSSVITLYFYLRLTYTAIFMLFFKPFLVSPPSKLSKEIKSMVLIPVLFLPFSLLIM